MSTQLEILLPGIFDHGFDYAVPEGMALAPGDVVRVPFGRGSQLGVVWGEGTAQVPAGKLKHVQEKLDYPPLSPKLREFIRWAAWYNCAPLGAVLKMVLPIGADALDVRRKSKLSSPNPESPIPNPTLARLTDVQRLAAQQITQHLGKGFSVSLLDGVTGSGKTEVYFEAIAQTLGTSEISHASCLILLPEIALSVQWLERFEQRFGFRPLVWNSTLTPAQRREGWKAVARGQAPVVVGARSALFLPYANLQLLVVDEEHDGSYKQEEGVMYHARDMSVARGRHEGFPVVLVSATPSLESYYNARLGKYHEVTLPRRHGAAGMPDIHLIDMRMQKLDRGAFLSAPLREAVAQAMAKGQQAMLFLNRRGYAPLVLCRRCGHRFECAECSSWLVMHQYGIRDSGLGIREERPNPESRTPKADLCCHHCNHRQPLPPACPACAAEESLAACGPGVERVHEEAQALFPQARIGVMASDQLESPLAMAGLIAQMERGEIDLLIGTQMVAKGHHFSGLSVVGVVDADLGLNGGDLRAAEKTYQLLHQLSGRAGREATRGAVLLQSYQPTHPVMQALLSGEREAFLAAELAARENAQMPPFSRLAALIIEGEKEEAVMKTARQLAAAFPESRTPNAQTHLLGPAPAPLYRLRGKYRWRLLVKAGRKVNVPELVRNWIVSIKPPSSVRIKIDIDPVGFL
jgi:primosomal protein N' (replication factor Y)